MNLSKVVELTRVKQLVETDEQIHAVLGKPNTLLEYEKALTDNAEIASAIKDALSMLGDNGIAPSTTPTPVAPKVETPTVPTPQQNRPVPTPGKKVCRQGLHLIGVRTDEDKAQCKHCTANTSELPTMPSGEPPSMVNPTNEKKATTPTVERPKETKDAFRKLAMVAVIHSLTNILAQRETRRDITARSMADTIEVLLDMLVAKNETATVQEISDYFNGLVE
jgi:hypothetical protein